MELIQILKRFSEGLQYIDANTFHATTNARTGETYLPGVKTMTEKLLVEEFSRWWNRTYPDDFNPQNAIAIEVPYKNLARAACDLQLSTEGSSLESPEWAIEVKHIALVGNNGKNNDYGVAKILSPYLKDRSLIHDIERLRKYSPARRKAVLGYCFSYSPLTIKEARKRHPEYEEYIANIEKTCRTNDPKDLIYTCLPLIQFANDIFKKRNLVEDLIMVEFGNVWKHPCGGEGIVFGWEVKD